jgi:hypothetical protein
MRKTTFPKIIRRLLIAAAALPLAIIAATQVALSTPLFLRAINAAFAGEVSFGYESAWSWWPGRVHVRGLRMQGEDSNVQWVLRVEETEATIAVGELLHRTFHATRSRSTGVSFVTRLKMPRADATAERLFGLVQIPGFDPLPLRTEGPDELDTEERYRLWTIHLDDTVAEVREMWAERFHFTGRALVTGGFFLKPVRRAQVAGQLQATSLELRVGDDLVARDLRGHLAVSLDPFDPREVHGLDVLGQASLQAQFDGQLAGLEFVQRMVPPGIRVEGAPGALLVDLRVDRGKVSPGSALEVRSPQIGLEFWRLRAQGEAALALRIPDTQGSLALELLSFSLAPLGSFPMPMRAKRARLEVTSDSLDLTRPLSWRSIVADLEGGALPDLQILEALLPPRSGVRIEGGQAWLSGHVEATPQASQGRIDFAAHEATVSAAGTRLRASLHGRARLRPKGPHTLDLSDSKVSIDHVNLLHSSNAPDWWGDFRIPSALLDVEAKTLSLKMKGECRDARPLAGLFSAQGVPDFISNIFSMEGLHASGGLRVAPDELALLDVRAEGNGAQIRANYRSRGRAKRGAALFSAHGLSAGIDLDGGNSSIVLLNPVSWYGQRLHDKDLLAQSGLPR